MGEPRSFRMDRRSPEAARLREAVSKKLLDFLGNYSDEVLAEYIVVLVCNGKHQNQACDDLEAFLGEDSKTFVVWLWDYLSKEFMSKWTSEVESLDDHDDNLGRECRSSILADQHVDSVGPPQVEEAALHKGPDPKSGNCTRATTNLSSLVTCSHEASSTTKRPLQHELQHQIPTDYSIAASVQSLTDSKMGQTATCLRSVIAAEEHQLQALSGRNSIESRLCAAAIDDESDQKTHPRGNVWDRLGRPPEDKQDQDFDFIEKKMDHQVAPQNPRLMRISSASGSTSGLRKQSYGTDRANDENPAADEYKAFDKLHKNNLKRRRQIGEFCSNNDASFCEENLLQNKARPTKVDALSLPVNHNCQESVNKLADIADSSVTSDAKFGSIKPACVLLDTKTSLFSQSQVNEQSSMMVSKENPATVCTIMPVKSESDNKIGVSNSIQKPVQDEVLSVKSRLHQVEMDMLKLRAKQVGLHNDGKPNLPSVTQNLPDEDIESRTVMVANVHFAATREALILHFAKCGAIAKVVMLTDAVTAMPKGAAYIVFVNKDSVSKAISLSGTSFFSRILKVVRKADVPPDFLVPSSPAMKQLQSFYPQAYRKYSTQKQQYTSSNLQWRRDQCTNRANPLTTSSTGLGSSNSGG